MWLTTGFAFQIAVMRESDARGPFCSTVMAVVVVKDVLLFVCLAMNLEFANMVRGSYEWHSVSHALHAHTSHCSTLTLASGQAVVVSVGLQNGRAEVCAPCTTTLRYLLLVLWCGGLCRFS